MGIESNPVYNVRWVPLEKVRANDYNPNSVARREMDLLYRSIKSDGYTSPVVTVYDADQDVYIIVDGFHRHLVMKQYKDIYRANDGLLPVVVLEKSVNDRMASTVRHNRARGKHAVEGMSTIVFDMLNNGWKDADICMELGMEHEELIRLKHITGFSKLFENVEYRRAYESDKQIKIKKEWNKNNDH